MKRVFFLLMIPAVLVGYTPSVVAQNKTAPKVSIVLKNTDELLKDLEFILKLTKPAAQKQWPILKSQLDFFIINPDNKRLLIDTKKPFRIDLLLGEDVLNYRTSLPVPNLKEFDDKTLGPVGVVITPINGTLYSCKDAFNGYMRYVHQHTIFASKRQHIPQDIADPSISIKKLAGRFDLGLQFKNQIKGLEDRKKWFDDTRKELLAAVKRKDDESAENFSLRKMMSEQQLEELGRLYTEASELTLGWNTDTKKKEGRLDFEATALENTSLAKSIALLGQKPSHFANIPTPQTSILSGRFNHPLDDLRKENLIEFSEIIKTRAEKDIDTDKGRDAEQKTNSKKIVGLIHDLIKQNAQAGLLDGFIEIRLNKSGKKTAVGGFRTEDGTVLVELLKLIPKSKKGRKAELDVAKEGDISIHKLTIPAKDHPFLAFFIEDDTAYVGTSKESVWFAAGENALEELKTAIQQVGKENTGKASDPFVSLSMNLKPWIQQRAKRQGNKGDVKLRQQALDAFLPDEDKLTFEMKLVENKILGTLTVQQGILRLAGEIIATAVKENL